MPSTPVSIVAQEDRCTFALYGKDPASPAWQGVARRFADLQEVDAYFAGLRGEYCGSDEPGEAHRQRFGGDPGREAAWQQGHADREGIFAGLDIEETACAPSLAWRPFATIEAAHAALDAQAGRVFDAFVEENGFELSDVWLVRQDGWCVDDAIYYPGVPANAVVIPAVALSGTASASGTPVRPSRHSP